MAIIMNIKQLLTFTEQPFKNGQAVYRIYNFDKNLIYVGVTNDVLMRIAQHRRDKIWRDQITIIELDWCETRSEALAIENMLIEKMQPLYNLRQPRKKVLCEHCNETIKK